MKNSDRTCFQDSLRVGAEAGWTRSGRPRPSKALPCESARGGDILFADAAPQRGEPSHTPSVVYRHHLLPLRERAAT
ncbi:MAG: hypothetical protein PHO93_04820 [Candidatus Saccharimonadaceae bacterium]|nr:hypothetical protein [Candidatus Saccharimonadaceae bacterium]